MAKIDYGKVLYELLPDALKDADRNANLAGYLNVLGVGLQILTDEIERFPLVTDPDQTPAEYIQYLAQTLGVTFPHDVDEQIQRNFIKLAVPLYKYKGTPTSLKLLVKQLTGWDAEITTEDFSTRELTISLIAPAEAANTEFIRTKLTQFIQFYTPAGVIPHVSFSVVFFDTYNLRTKHDYETIVLAEYRDEIWTKPKLEAANDALIPSDRETYMLPTRQDESRTSRRIYRVSNNFRASHKDWFDAKIPVIA